MRILTESLEITIPWNTNFIVFIVITTEIF